MVKVGIVFCLSVGLVVYNAINFMYKQDYSPGLGKKTKMYISTKENFSYSDCNKTLCPWQNYSITKTSPEYLEEKSNLKILQETGFCKPTTFGYTDSEFNRIFQNKTFPTCSEYTGVTKEIMHINSENRKLYMNCSGYYYIGGPAYDDIQGIYDYKDKGKLYIKSVVLDNSQEWAYGSCSDPKKIEGATYIIEENKQAKDRTIKKMNEIFEGNGTRKSIRPMTVLNIFIDSVSRKNFYRKLPKTQEFLNEINGKGFRVYDFKLSSAIGDNTLPNLFPLWAGEKLEDIPPEIRSENAKKDKDLIYSKSIWKYLKDRGWMTMFGTEFCNDYFAYGIGRRPSVDHHMSRFWCGARTLTEFGDTQQTLRCIGTKTSQYYLFNTTLQYIRMYQGLNKWAHIMSVAAHEDSGTLITVLDNDLYSFLKQTLETQDDIIIFIGADHGMRYGEWYKLDSGGQEHRLPSFFLIVSQNIINSLPYSNDILEHNTKRLISKFEYRKTIEHLSMLPYDLRYLQDSDKPKANESTSLFLHKVSDERHCDDIGIDAEYCPCPDFVDFNDMENCLVLDVANAGVYEINTYAVYNANAGWKVCRKVTVKEVISAKWAVQEYKALVKVNFTINEVENVSFEVIGMVLGTFMKHKPREEGYLFRVYYYNTKRLLRIQGINSSYYNETCSILAEERGIAPNICVCY
ncbi:hypothetical protein SteCoe_31250 [Stentor coeruleus]|uniref:Uncharacterized protein n=1 Tax=Stentor coeruleus TaxID=5963 RepID=A0A1R2B271_9CILI|nr:hypothetical protein SteCoe_31250 [Stentor coeruleus]